jgi:hypothetical protein
MVAKDKVDGLVSTATAIRLIDVQPFQEHLLQTRGFVISQDGRIFGNEGAVMLTMADGLVHFLFFGEVAVDEEDKEGDAVANNRYLVVFVRYDESKDQTLQDLLREQQVAVDAKQKAETIEEQPEAEPQPERDFAQEIAARKARGLKQAEDKQTRFSKFFYVIDDDSFKRLRPSREELFIDPPKKADEKKKK